MHELIFPVLVYIMDRPDTAVFARSHKIAEAKEDGRTLWRSLTKLLTPPTDIGLKRCGHQSLAVSEVWSPIFGGLRGVTTSLAWFQMFGHQSMLVSEMCMTTGQCIEH